MAFLDLIPQATYKALENRAAFVHDWLLPVKRLTRGYSPFPVAVVALVTFRCNLDCVMCCQHIPEYAADIPGLSLPGKSAQGMSLSRWKEIVDEIAETFPLLPFFHFGGGEPFLYPGLLDLLVHTKGRGFSTSVITNGWTLATHARDLVSLGVNRINVSIDGTETVHDEIRRRKGSFLRAVNGIRAIRKEREKAGRDHPRVTINCTITPQNVSVLEEMVKVRDEAGADALTIEHLMFPDEDRTIATGLDVDALLEVLPRLEKRERVTLYPRIPRKLWRQVYEGSGKDLGRGCGMLWELLRIHPNGEVGPCRGLVLGNAATGRESLKEIWNNEGYMRVRRELADGGPVAACARCCHVLY